MTFINEYLSVVVANEGDAATIRCRCGKTIGPANDNYKKYVLRYDAPVQKAGPWVDPHNIGEGRFVCREFYCPQCLTLLDVEIAQKDEPPLWDVRLDV